MEHPKILIFDIETAPSTVYTWVQYKTNVIATKEDWYLLSVAWKWYGDDDTQFARKAVAKGNDKALTKLIHSLLNEADVVVAHNGDNFDVKKVNARFLYHELGPPSPYTSIDTLKEVKRFFRLYANSLNEIARYLKLDGKVSHSGISLWLGCMANDPVAWGVMEEYNRQDVVVLEAVLDALSPYMGTPGKASTGYNPQQWHGSYVCTKIGCGSGNTIKRGFHRTKASVYQTVQCKTCKGYSRYRSTNTGANDGAYR